MRQPESMKKAESGRMFWDDRKKGLLGKGVFLLAILVIGTFLCGEPQAAVIEQERDLLIGMEKILLTIAVAFGVIGLLTE